MLKTLSEFLSISWKFGFGTDAYYHLCLSVFPFSIPPRKILGLITARKMDSMKEENKRSEKYLDAQLWHACAGGMVEIPPVNSKVFYFPQGHAEMADGELDFRTHTIPPLVLARISAIRFMADSQTDEVFAEIALLPLNSNDFESGEDDKIGGNNPSESEENHTSFAKTLTQSDANNGGGFSVPRYCAETIFPALNYSANPPFQTINVKDVHGQIWKFRHIYRGTPRRHLLTSGWSNFVNYKKLVAGDSIVFLKADNGELRIGIRRARRGVGGQFACSRRTVPADSIIESAILASRGNSFVVKYFPRSNTPPFLVGAGAVRAAMRVPWSAGMRFKMAFETEDLSRISWFMGTISSVQVSDPCRWPNSPWRLLQITWDEPELLQNVKLVNPWSIEVVTNMLPYHISPFGAPAKKPKLLPTPEMSPEFVKAMSDFPGMLDVTLAGIQGARQFQSTLSALNLSKFQATTLPMVAENNSMGSGGKSEWLNLKPSEISKEKELKTQHILLFGQVILVDQNDSMDNTIDTVGNSPSEKTDTSDDGVGASPPWNSLPENLSDAGSRWCKDHQKTIVDIKTGHCN